uniref:Uncharacterized LOC100181482 n=1 Tax=Ciona intestinalis TaxID=7719 RepID=H2XMI4_CIOIN|nr:uncharacterized protein LOC100181482 [Ciona intestinalis]|eukprot:XP_002119579.1 uncharacterized protein LOC100181482 [Ciona intestinalis]
MAMSKCCFFFLLLIVLAALGGGVGIVIWVMNKNTKVENEEVATTPAPDNFSGSREECENWLRNPAGTSVRFTGVLGRSSLATRTTMLERSSEIITRNAHWLTGDETKDATALRGIRLEACGGKIPTVVIRIRPTEGLQLNNGISNWDYYKPTSPISTWTEYDEKLNSYLRVLAPIPAVVVLEPDLLMYAFDSVNQQYRWRNAQYEEEFLKRARKVIVRMNKAWVYVDAGNAGYLGSSTANLDQMATTLLRLPGLRGFSINTMHFINQTYNNLIASRLHCRTGLNFVVDTSRNRGEFSTKSILEMERCLFDPPHVRKGQIPSWGWGSKTATLRTKRYAQQQQVDRNNNNFQQTSSPTATNSNSNRFRVRTVAEASEMLRSFRSRLRRCATKPKFAGNDANLWLKTPGESDGRLYPYGTFRSCLLEHAQGCDDSCQMNQQRDSNQRPQQCQCDS